MSQMSQLERHARAAAAMSLLNRLRHQMSGRARPNLDPDQINVIGDALDMSRENQLSHNTVKYSFRGLPDGGRSAALQLSEAFLASFVALHAEGQEWEEYLRSLQILLDSGGKLEASDRARVKEFTEVAMDILGSQSNQPVDSPFKAKII